MLPAGMTWQGWVTLIVVVALLVQKMTKRHHLAEWMRFASDKAKAVVLELRAENRALKKENAQLQEDKAELRGRLRLMELSAQPSYKVPLIYDEHPSRKAVAGA